MKYKIKDILTVLINQRLTKIDDVFICYYPVYDNWIIISKYLDENNYLNGYMIKTYDTVPDSFRLIKFCFMLDVFNYYKEIYKKTVFKRDFQTYTTLIGRINYAITKQDLRTKHLAAINAKENVIKF